MRLQEIDAMESGPAKDLALIAWNRENTPDWEEPPAELIEQLEAALLNEASE